MHGNDQPQPSPDETPTERYKRRRPPPDQLPLDAGEKASMTVQVWLFGAVLMSTVAIIAPIEEPYITEEAIIEHLTLNDGLSQTRNVAFIDPQVTLWFPGTGEHITIAIDHEEFLALQDHTTVQVIGISRCAMTGVEDAVLREDGPCSVTWQLEDQERVAPHPYQNGTIAAGTVTWGMFATHGIYRRWWQPMPRPRDEVISPPSDEHTEG